MKYKLNITGLHCANCAMELEELILELDCVESANVSFANKIVFVECDENTLIQVKNICNNFEDVKVIEDTSNVKKDDSNKELILILISIGLFIIGVLIQHLIQIEWLYIVIYICSYLVCGFSVLKSTFKNIIKGKLFDESFLMTISSIGAMFINEVMEGAIVMILYQIGEYLQEKAVNSSRKEIASLVNLKIEEANLLIGDKVKKIKSEELKIDDIVLIKKGERVPVDCVILDQESEFDTKSLTGEALLKTYKVNEEILSGYINQGNVIKAKVIRTYNNSAISKILNLIENSTETKANTEKFITKFAKVYTPLVCIIALVIGLIVPTILGIFTGDWANLYASYIYKALILLVISCPCALVISVPLSYFSAVGSCAKNGILVKGASYLDILSNVSTACFDKTGTLTEGNFKVINYSNKEALLIAASAEKNSSHPLAKAFENIYSPYQVDNIEEISGKGIKCTYLEDKYLIGNSKLLIDNKVNFELVKSLSTVIYVCKNNQLIGYIEIDDIVKIDAKESIDLLKQVGVKNLVLLSGDNQNRVDDVASKLGLNQSYGELQPEDKLNKLLELKKDGTVIYVGDGINDAPVMMNADCSFSMGKIGSDIAIDASDIVLIEDNISSINKAIKISKKTKNIVLQNIIFSIVCKVLFMVLGVLDIIPLVLAIFADVGVMLIAVLNSFRVKSGVK